jgi:hypothetical protein
MAAFGPEVLAPAAARRRFPPAPQSGLQAAFILQVQGCALAIFCGHPAAPAKAASCGVGIASGGSTNPPCTKSDYESWGQEFESLRARQRFQWLTLGAPF